MGETPELVPVLFGLWRFYNTRAQLHTAREIGETLLRLAQRAHDPALSVVTGPFSDSDGIDLARMARLADTVIPFLCDNTLAISAYAWPLRKPHGGS